MRAKPVHRDATQATRREELIADGILIEQSPSHVAAKRDALAWRERDRVADIPLERDEPAFAGKHVLVLGLHVPERPQTEGIDAEDARVADADQDPRRPLRQRPDRGAPLDVGVLKLRAHPLHLVHDRREEELERLDRTKPEAHDKPTDDRVHVLRVAALA